MPVSEVDFISSEIYEMSLKNIFEVVLFSLSFLRETTTFLLFLLWRLF